MNIFYGIVAALFITRTLNSKEPVSNTLDMIASVVALGLFINSF